ncbi:esterase/lipase/thioesterase family protein [Piscinibacter sakaiensis]|uniref:Esterase/lipase/thioesterase family protein n=1 Tax=Piscinibacter sakaiensis TaxID=1547922 RepID=A0A0K8P404_PISS1|nr:esterase/lipase/thioesterase family protein [Piscinibacter sakaiensis]
MLVAGLLGACSPTATLNALAATDSHRREDGLPYGTLPRQRYDLYRPNGAAPAGGWPMVVYFYGGSWRSGERADYRFVGEALAARGVLTLVADYRLYPEVRYPDFLRDGAAVLALTLERAGAWGGDPRRVFVMGHSAGAYIASMLALDERWLGERGHRPQALAGWIGLAGPYDFLPTTVQAIQPVFHHPQVPAGALSVEHVGPQAPPAFLAVAPDDRVVDPVRNTGHLADRLQAAGVPVRLARYPRTNHATLVGAYARPLRWLAPVLDDTLAFIDATPAAGRAAGAATAAVPTGRR